LKTQKWNFRAEKNQLMKEIYNRPTNSSNSEGLTPSVDEWLKMSKKRRNPSYGDSNTTQSN
jgi:hypothetical protein